VEDGSGVKQVDGDPNQLETLASGEVVAKKNGYVYVYTSNESQQDVLFDNMSVTQATGPVLEETHYYPYGLAMAGISTVGPLRIANAYRYNGKELNHEEFSDNTGLELYDYGFREYDPQIARFPQLDPLTDEFAVLTPYQYASNDPVGNIDLDGLEGVGSVGGLAADASKGIDASVRLEEVVVKAVQPTTVASVSKAFIKGFGKDLWGAVKGTAHALIHIDQTAVTIAKLQNPVDQQFMGIAAYQTLRGTTERFRNGNANDKAEIIGAGVGEIAQLFGGELAEVGKIGEIGKLSEVTSDIAKITEEVDKTAVAAKTSTTGFRYMSQAELKAIQETGYLRGGWSGETYFTKDLYKSAAKAQSRLSLGSSPALRVEFEILNNPTLLRNGTKVTPLNGMFGGGSEFMTLDPVKVRLINWQPLR